MDKLPKYFIIKKDNSNPLWKSYINWLNETYVRSWSGKDYNYYGLDGNRYHNGTNAYTNKLSFLNNPVLITLEEWDRIVNNPIKYKFKVGDKVKVIEGGYGFGYDDLNKVYTITELGIYDNNICKVKHPGYKVSPPGGNITSFNGFNGELSFELVDNCEPFAEGTYVVFLENNIQHNECKKGDVQKIKHKRISLDSEGIYYTSGYTNTIKGKNSVADKLKWFKTKKEAEEFSKRLLNEDKPMFEKGKWYKSINWSSVEDFIKCEEYNESHITGYEYIYQGEYKKSINMWPYKDCIEASPEEYSQYLPDGHPDKLPDKLPNEDKLVFGKFNIGDIVICVKVSSRWAERKEGDMYKVLPNSTKNYLYYKNNMNTYIYNKNDWRLATEEEVEAYNKGIKNINDIDNPHGISKNNIRECEQTFTWLLEGAESKPSLIIDDEEFIEYKPLKSINKINTKLIN